MPAITLSYEVTQNSSQQQNTKNGIAEISNQHQVAWDAATIKHDKRGYWKRRLLEALHIQQQPQTSNLDCGLTIKPSRLPLLDKPPSS